MFPPAEYPTISIRWEDPDLVITHATTHGKMDAVSVRRLLETLRKVQEKRSDFYWVDNFDQCTGVTPDVFEVVREINVAWNYRAIVMVGGSLTMRAVANIFLRGLILIGRFNPEIANVRTEEEARAWISAHRQKFLKTP